MENMSRQQKRQRVRAAAKTIGKLNHCLKNQPETARAANMNAKNIHQAMNDLREMGIIPPPTLWQKVKGYFREAKRYVRFAYRFLKTA
jgi:hypothetical protein